MDPIACLMFINDTEESNRERCERIVELAEWFAKGGMVPSFDCITNKTMAMAVDEGYGDIAAAVNNVCANGDLSGLEGLGYAVSR